MDMNTNKQLAIKWWSNQAKNASFDDHIFYFALKAAATRTPEDSFVRYMEAAITPVTNANKLANGGGEEARGKRAAAYNAALTRTREWIWWLARRDELWLDTKEKYQAQSKPKYSADNAQIARRIRVEERMVKDPALTAAVETFSLDHLHAATRLLERGWQPKAQVDQPST